MRSLTPPERVALTVAAAIGLPWFLGSLWFITGRPELWGYGWLRMAAMVGSALPWLLLLAAVLLEERSPAGARRCSALGQVCAGLVFVSAFVHVLFVKKGLLPAIVAFDVAGVVKALGRLGTPALVLIAEAPLLALGSWHLRRGIDRAAAARRPRVAGSRVQAPSGPRPT